VYDRPEDSLRLMAGDLDLYSKAEAR